MIEQEINKAFDEIHAEESLKESTKEFLAKRTSRLAGRKRHIRIAAAACCFLLLVGLGSNLWFTPVAAVSIDINPSVGLSLNRFDRVISVTGYNPEGKQAVEETNLLFLSCSDAVERLLDTQSLSVYLAQDQEVSVTVSGENEEKNAALLEAIETQAAACGHSVSCHSASTETAHAAHHSGLSTGKYQAFLEWQALDPTVTVEDCAALSLREIRERIAALQAGEPASSEESDSPSNSTNATSSTSVASNAGNHHGENSQTGGKHHQHRYGSHE